MNILMIDNFDSFTYNLVDEFEKRNCKVYVYRNNISFENFEKIIKKINPKLIVISPGPSAPKNAGISVEIIKAFGGIVDKSPEVFHGKPSKVTHDKKAIYRNVENPFQVGRYHSLAGLKIPDELVVSAKSETNIAMGIRHKKFFIEGVQFHPESILTPSGGLIIENLLEELK